ncbi:hypothetical protein AGABI2DRAFT_195752 [Agaricus bisporus var. bisporus H97]|uniref:hypothetical protein n=1 Tax=Agaricus bisporus var. bisporus (strain H97 / ATCC MYA-4626 / FGSC 10389) TaxID=936046 RepID=UPI00029F6E75|nr:hypothetical protein AGABI2DRAFT_195752 [Agaricus bisporus var. bisporus H97]EKV42406.1 hypothetical protein AGABI2DRAFT_195752 [Agaricus bisporus var. bisporus H97]
MSNPKSRNVLAIAAATVATGVLAYLVYFDYKRRNDSQFRKKLRKEKKRVNKTVAEEKSQSAASDTAPSDTELLREALEQVKSEHVPSTSEEKETYFMTQVSMGEQLASQGPSLHVPAAIAFYKALRVYPTPVELIMIYQKTVPEAIFKLIIDLTNLDAAARISNYYNCFPPKSMNVEIKSNETGRKIMLATKDIAAGETIYKEFPVVAVLDADLESSGKYCSHCFRELQDSDSSAIRLSEDVNSLGSSYCSEECLNNSKIQSTSLLFTLESPLPPELPTSEDIDNEGRKAAQAKFVEYLQKEKRAGPLLVARFISRQVAVETAKLVKKDAPMQSNDFTTADGGDYMLVDHMERFRYLEVQPKEEELPLIANVLQKTLPGLEQFVTKDRYTTLVGKMLYNAIGVGSRDDKPESTARPEDQEKTRTPVGTQKQVGAAFYTLSSYANHSCAPSAKLTFPSGTTELHVVATKDIKMGDEVSVAYVDVSPAEGESIADARRRRRVELARGWRFACPCELCEEEGKDLTKEEKGHESEEKKDESKVEFEDLQRGMEQQGAAEKSAEVE